MDTEYVRNYKKQATSARQGRRQFNWERANRPKFGPENGWEVDPIEVTRTDKERRAYLWTGTF